VESGFGQGIGKKYLVLQSSTPTTGPVDGRLVSSLIVE
jgi:hypothetical protein